MPKRKFPFKKKKGKKKTFKKKKFGTSLSYSGRGFLPLTFITSMEMNNTHEVDDAASINATYQWEIMDIYHPDLTGDQTKDTSVNGFTQMIGMYQEWQVISCSIDLLVVNAGDDALLFSMAPWNQGGDLGNTEKILSQPYNVSKIVAAKGSGPNVQRLHMFVTVKGLQGRNPSTKDYPGGAATSPVKRMRWNLRVHNLENNTELHWNYRCKLRYRVKWFGLLDISAPLNPDTFTIEEEVGVGGAEDD